jgi:DNA topoisomerase-1
MGVDVENRLRTEIRCAPGERPSWSTSLNRAAKQAKEVYLATPTRREGGDLAWHPGGSLQDGQETILPRVFREITDEAVKDAFKKPRDIDMRSWTPRGAAHPRIGLVGLQHQPVALAEDSQAPFRGPVQSVAVRIIVEPRAGNPGLQARRVWSSRSKLSKKREKTPSGRL